MSQRQLLLVADDALDDPDAVDRCLGRAIEAGDRVRVVAPVMAGRLDVAAGDEAAFEEARARARAVVEALRAAGVEADGEHTESAPGDVVLTEVVKRDHDGVVVVTREEGHWREEGLLERLRSRVQVPVTEVTLGG